MHDHADALALLRAGIGGIYDREPAPAEDRIMLWQDLAAVRADLEIVYRDVENDATEALVERLRETGEPALETPLGVVHVGTSRPGDRWEGHKLLAALARHVADPSTGEMIRAVPLDVLRDVVPGCASDNLTSSRWRITSLRSYVDPYNYVERGAPVPVIRAGPPR